MPELPEVEHLRRTLEPVLLGATITDVDLRRTDVLRLVDEGGKATRFMRRPGRDRIRTIQHALLLDTRIVELLRHGKNLAIVGDNGRALCVHLGMSGRMCFVPDGETQDERDHVHCTWRIEPQRGGPADRGRSRTGARSVCGTLIFRDPRRFGGLWAFDSIDSMWKRRFNALGPDALSIRASQLAEAVQGSRRSIKAALLDQTAIAGVGNIYADEALFRARIHPQHLASDLETGQIEALAGCLRDVLRAAIRSGGSSLRDYVDGNGRAGRFTLVHQAYGRAGEPCVRCGSPMVGTTIAQRTTVFCPICQRSSRTRSGRNRSRKGRD